MTVFIRTEPMTGRMPNDYSLVLQLTYKNFRGVFMGDLGEKGEKEILSALRPVTFLKTLDIMEAKIHLQKDF